MKTNIFDAAMRLSSNKNLKLKRVDYKNLEKDSRNKELANYKNLMALVKQEELNNCDKEQTKKSR